MSVIWEYIVHFFSLFKIITVFDIIDIAALSAVLFAVYLFMKERRAGKLALGVGFVFILLLICNLLSLKAMQFILSHAIEVGLVMLVVIFQPEIRSGLEKLGGNSLRGIKAIGEQKSSAHTIAMIDEISNATFELAKSKTGAIIVFERNTKLGDIILTGTVINAQVSSYLLRNIFYDKAPLHDGAVILQDGRLTAAGCMLPLTANNNLSKELGMRHRAGIGVSEQSDAVVVIVSEESGSISVAIDGMIKRHLSPETLERLLRNELMAEVDEEKKNGIFGFLRVKK